MKTGTRRAYLWLTLLMTVALVANACGGAKSPGNTGGQGTPAPKGGDGGNAERATVSPENMTATVEAKGVVVSKPEAGKTNVTWWTHNNPAFVAANKEMIARFEKANPDTHIVYQYFPYDVFVRKLQAGYRSQTVANMQQMFGTWVTEYARNGLLDPVPQDMAGTMKDRFWEAALGAYGFEGRYYGMPNEYNLENGGMLVSPKLLQSAGLKEAPKTWTDLVSAAEKLTKRDDKGKISQSGFAFTNNDSLTFLFLSMILQQGATYWADDGTHVNFSTPQAKKAWQDETALATKSKVDNEQSYTGDSYEVFFRGKAGMAMRGPWVIAVGKDEFPKFQFRYDPMPPYNGKVNKFAAESGWGEVVNAKADPKVKAMAWKFIDFMHQEDNIRDWNIRTFTVPSLKALKDDPQILKAAPDMKTSFAVLPYGQWVGPVQDRDRFWQYIHDAFTSVELGRKEPLDALADAEKQINAMIDEKIGP